MSNRCQEQQQHRGTVVLLQPGNMHRSYSLAEHTHMGVSESRLAMERVSEMQPTPRGGKFRERAQTNILADTLPSNAKPPCAAVLAIGHWALSAAPIARCRCFHLRNKSLLTFLSSSFLPLFLYYFVHLLVYFKKSRLKGGCLLVPQEHALLTDTHTYIGPPSMIIHPEATIPPLQAQVIAQTIQASGMTRGKKMAKGKYLSRSL